MPSSLALGVNAPIDYTVFTASARSCFWVSTAFKGMTDRVNLAEKLALFGDHWKPRTVAQLNNFDIMVVKVQGEFVWHKHDETDDFFLVLSGRLQIHLRDRTVILNPGELFVVPRGMEHQPFSEQETHVLLIEPTGTPNTGNVETAAPRQVL
jgi:mannose-6-phosphate isomerase-like protein (cupin superfamily)